MTKWYILRPFGTFCDHLAFFSRSGILYREKSGNPDWHALRHAFKLQQIGAIIKSHAQFFWQNSFNPFKVRKASGLTHHAESTNLFTNYY
jgi:hypothetical protein